jgi:cyclic pyranopterin phosphate synthase
MASLTHPAHVADRHARNLGDLRVSVTDRCNLRCSYCMPEEEYTWLPQPDLLAFEEIARLVDVFTELGVSKVRLTGGEPLMRRELPVLVSMLARKPAIADLAMTTNGVLLGDRLDALRDAGLHRLTVSLDTLRPERFRALSRRDGHEKVIASLGAAASAGFTGTKIDTVVIRGFNDDELADLIEFGRGVQAEVRFIEYMDVGGATRWSMDKVISRSSMLQVLQKRYGPIEPVPPAPGETAPAVRFALPDGTVFGIVSSTTEPFCATCNRARLTADGTWYLCLYAQHGLDLRGPLREGASHEELVQLVRGGWAARADRGAEARLRHRDRAPLIPIHELRQDPRLEMHTRGG